MESKNYTDYDNFAFIYYKHWGDFYQGLLPRIEELALDNASQNAKILDLCCGTGQLTKVLVDKGHNVTGIDSSK